MKDQMYYLERTREALVPFVRENLGPASAQWVQSASEESIEKQIEANLEGNNLGLAIIFDGIQKNGKEANDLRQEFFGFLYRECSGRRGLTRRYPSIQSCLDTHDFLGNVILELLEMPLKIEFRGLAEFRRLILLRMAWLASSASKRKENCLKSQANPEDFLALESASPLEEILQAENMTQVQIAIGKLHWRDRALVEAHLSGESTKEIANQMGMKLPATRKALQRALGALRYNFLQANSLNSNV